MRLHSEEVGSGPDLLLIHGFLGNRSTWHPVLAKVSSSYRCIAFDLPGCGLSPPPSEPLTLALVLDNLLQTLDAHGVDACGVLGYSMGGRIAMHLQARHPDRVSMLILEGANPGIDDPGERADRMEADERQARRIETEGIAAFVDSWEELPLFQSQETLPESVRDEIRATRLASDPASAAAYLRALSPGHLPSLWSHLPTVSIPVITIAGALDRKYVDISRAIHASTANCIALEIPDAGHTAHIEQPQSFADQVLSALAKRQM